MIDIHTHILAGLDDGSNDQSEVLNIIKQMSQNGVKTVFATPHYLEGMYNNHDITIKNAVKDLQDKIQAENIDIKLLRGCEVYLTPNSPIDIERENLQYFDTNYCLVECNVNSLETEVYQNLFNVLRRGYRPVLAHPERYRFIMSSSKAAKELIKRDVYFQINSGSLLGLYGKKVKETAWKLVHNGYAHFVASDTHCKELEYNLKQAYDKVVEHIDETSATLLFKTFPAKMMQNESIPTFYVEVHSSSRHRKKSLFRWL
ncbi:MAG: capsular biosynthesis protein [Candidatus Cloacimonetes bacterium]|nr:capsular biosynthesis protein [Candidatus Cloacimonadota bacterium]